MKIDEISRSLGRSKKKNYLCIGNSSYLVKN